MEKETNMPGSMLKDWHSIAQRAHS